MPGRNGWECGLDNRNWRAVDVGNVLLLEGGKRRLGGRSGQSGWNARSCRSCRGHGCGRAGGLIWAGLIWTGSIWTRSIWTRLI